MLLMLAACGPQVGVGAKHALQQKHIYSSSCDAKANCISVSREDIKTLCEAVVGGTKVALDGTDYLFDNDFGVLHQHGQHARFIKTVWRERSNAYGDAMDQCRIIVRWVGEVNGNSVDKVHENEDGPREFYYTENGELIISSPLDGLITE